MPGDAHIVRLGKDLISLDSEVVEIKVPITSRPTSCVTGTAWIYTYNTDWNKRTEGPTKEWTSPASAACRRRRHHTHRSTPTVGSMDNYFKNPGTMAWTSKINNHTHLQKYKGDYYLFYHNMCLGATKGTNGGFRSLLRKQATQVDEKNVKIEMGQATLKGKWTR